MSWVTLRGPSSYSFREEGNLRVWWVDTDTRGKGGGGGRLLQPVVEKQGAKGGRWWRAGSVAAIRLQLPAD